jgi:7-cyano-7-deazaguanine synthase in queuosine biosynthesis
MCVFSMIMDHYDDKWNKKIQEPRTIPYTQPVNVPHVTPDVIHFPYVTKEEVEEFRRLLERAREYDKRNNEPDCEMESKRRRILDLAKELGVEINFL